MTTPVGTNVGDRFESMRDPVIEFVLVGILQLDISEPKVPQKKNHASLTVSDCDLEIHLVTTF